MLLQNSALLFFSDLLLTIILKLNDFPANSLLKSTMTVALPTLVMTQRLGWSALASRFSVLLPCSQTRFCRLQPRFSRRVRRKPWMEESKTVFCPPSLHSDNRFFQPREHLLSSNSEAKSAQPCAGEIKSPLASAAMVVSNSAPSEKYPV